MHYPIVGSSHYSEFNVPALPTDIANCYYIYYNIDWQPAGPPSVKQAMNQFVPQLMLGEALDDSSNAPHYLPRWHNHKTWVFGAQYFFEIFNTTTNKTEPHAATGTTFPTVPGDVLYTSFTLSDDWAWTLTMGVKGDETRISTVLVKQPFMGLLPASETTSWSETVYDKAWSNTCWELYGVTREQQYPSNDMNYVINISTNVSGSVQWNNWTTKHSTCPGSPVVTISNKNTPTKQTILWNVRRPHPSKSKTSDGNIHNIRIEYPQCTTQTGVEYLGNDVFPPAYAETEGVCCESCFGNEKCLFYTYDSVSHMCWLKNTNAPDTSRGNATCSSGYPGTSPPAPPAPKEVYVSVDLNTVLSTTSSSYVCWNIDASANRGFFWRNISTGTALGASLAQHATVLGNVQEGGFSIVRFGGSGNDYVKYEFGDTKCNFPLSMYQQCLNQTTWVDFLDFMQHSNAKFIFGLSMNTGHDLDLDFLKKDDKSTPSPFPYPWDPTNAREILQWTIANGYDNLIYGFELGNEQNTQYSAKHQAVDFEILHNLTIELWPNEQQRPPLFGPDPHSFHGPTGVMLQWIGDWIDACHDRHVPIHGVTHHEYIEVDPTPEGFTSPARLALNGAVAKAIHTLVRKHDTQVGIWGGEIGPHNGGNPVCNHSMMRWAVFGDVLWYADAMASKALHGYTGFCRQDYIGGDYGLMDCSTGQPLPDYWLAVLFGKLMGTKVLKGNMTASSSLASIKTYVHCTNKKMVDGSSGKSDVTYMMINLSQNDTTVHVPTNQIIRSAWILAPSQLSGLTNGTGLMGTAIMLNGKELLSIKDVKGVAVHSTSVLLPRTSVGFFVVKVPNSVC